MQKYMTSKCNHNERGSCINCLTNKIRIEQTKPQKVVQQRPMPVTNKCNHPPKAKCINCIPVEERLLQSTKTIKSECEHPVLNKCNQCIQRQYYTSYDEYLQKLAADCIHKKPCMKCIPPQTLNYFTNKKCKNHLPYPQAMCNSCIPPTVSVIRQKHTHVRQLSIDVESMSKIKPTDNLALLFGTYDHQTVNVKYIYYPPQTLVDGKYSINDEYQQWLVQFTKLVQVVPVGILFDSAQMSSSQLLVSASLQQKYLSTSMGYSISRFVTVRIIRHPVTFACVSIQCLMVSDQFQSLVHNNLVYDVQEPGMFGLKISKSKNDDLPSFLRSGIETQRIAFHELMVWILIKQSQSRMTIKQYPVTNLKSTSIKEPLEYLKQQHHKYYSNLNLLLHIYKLFNVQSAIRLTEQSQCEQQRKKLIDSMSLYV